MRKATRIAATVLGLTAGVAGIEHGYLGSRDASSTPQEAAHLAGQSRLTDRRVNHGPLWPTIEGTLR